MSGESPDRSKEQIQKTLASLGNALEIELDGEVLSYDESLEQGPIDGTSHLSSSHCSLSLDHPRLLDLY